MALYFDVDELPRLGSRVQMLLRDEVQQEYRLIAHKPHTTRDGEASAVLTWATDCTECAEPVEFTTGPDSGNLYRRCKKCRRAFNRTREPGWSKGPRMRHVLLEPEEGYSLPAAEEGYSETPLYSALPSGERMLWLKSVKAAMPGAGINAIITEIEQRLRDEALSADPENEDGAEIDPAPRF